MAFFSRKPRMHKQQPEVDKRIQAVDRLATDGAEATLAVLEDVDNGTEFYMDIVDQFSLDGRNYAAMFPMTSKLGNQEPELVMLRVVSGEGAPNTLYESIRDRQELAKVFDAFCNRFAE